jgi:ketosteroid isomerase-like protein
MNRAFIFFCFAASLAASAHAADSERPNYGRISEKVFPETRDWQAVDSLPSPDMKSMLRDRELLRSIYLKTEQSLLMERPECSFITRALYDHFDLKLFRVADLDGDGFVDIVYSGYGECREGYATVVWFGAENGLAARPVGIMPSLLLKVETGGLRRISCVEPGCCAAVVDEYFIGDIGNPGRYAQVQVGSRALPVECATNEELALQVREAEKAFAQTMAARAHLAFESYVADEAVFFGQQRILRGRAAVAAGWKPFFEGAEAPFSWEPERVEVLDSGTLAFSSGPVRDPEGRQIGTFNSVWRREADGRWKIVFDKGCPPCDCPPKP